MSTICSDCKSTIYMFRDYKCILCEKELCNDCGKTIPGLEFYKTKFTYENKEPQEYLFCTNCAMQFIKERNEIIELTNKLNKVYRDLSIILKEKIGEDRGFCFHRKDYNDIDISKSKKYNWGELNL